MNIEAFNEVVNFYSEIIKTAHSMYLSATKKRCQLPQDLVAKRMDTDQLTGFVEEGVIYAHMLFMCENIKTLIPTKPDKAMRWLCFLQGSLWHIGLLPIDRFREDNVAIMATEE